MSGAGAPGGGADEIDAEIGAIRMMIARFNERADALAHDVRLFLSEVPTDGQGGKAPLTDAALADIEERAIAASDDKDEGDSWGATHGCVIAYRRLGAGKLDRIAVAMPGDRTLHGYGPDVARQAAFSRHMAGMCPRTTLRLVGEIRGLRAALAAREYEATSEPGPG